MFKMQTNKSTGQTVILTMKSGHKATFDSIIDAVKYLDIMKGLYVPRHKRMASEPYPVRSLNPGKYPVRVSRSEIRRRYGNG